MCQYGLDGPGIENRCGRKFSAHVLAFRPETHPASCSAGTESFFEAKRPGRGADHAALLASRLRMG